VDYAMLVRIYGPAITGTTRYSPPELVSVKKEWVMGQPKEELVSTSYVESQNTRMRTNIRRMTRLTNGHSKKPENHVHATSLWFMYYNFRRPHMTLTKENGGIKQTPAMAAGVSDHVWKLEEVVALLAD